MSLQRIGAAGALILLAGCAPVKHDPVMVPVTIVSRAQVHYPILAIQEAHEGTAVVLVLVGANGQNVDMRIDKSSGYRELDRAALACVREWVFRPETVDGVPTQSYARIPVRFDFGAQRKQIQLNAANRPILQYFPNSTTPPPPPPQH